MSARRVKRGARRNTGDIAFHLDNAIGACNRTLETSRDPETRELVAELKVRLLADRKAADLARRAAGRAQAQTTTETA